MKQAFIILFSILNLWPCKAQEGNNGKSNHHFSIGDIPNKSEFVRRNNADAGAAVIDIMFDSMLKADSGMREPIQQKKEEYMSNKALLFLKGYTNGEEVTTEELNNGLQTPCQCLVDNGKLKIVTGAGFFGGMGLETALADSSFQSSYFIYTDDVKPFKASLSDPFTDNLSVESKYQSLILENYPTYKKGQTLTGYLTFTSKEYYELQYGDQLDKSYVTGSAFFTCITKDGPGFRR